jgi:hypothetical protein
MREKSYTVYSYEELSDRAKARAVDGLRDVNVNHDWWDFIYEDAKTIGRLMGIEIENIYFSGFSSQGDGACFEGRYDYAKGSLKAVKENAPKDAELHRIALELYKFQRKSFYKAAARVKHRGHYNHSKCTDIEVWEEMQGTADDCVQLLRDFMDWIYDRLYEEYFYLTDDAQIIEAIEANGYEFDEDGKLE